MRNLKLCYEGFAVSNNTDIKQVVVIVLVRKCKSIKFHYPLGELECFNK